MVCWGSFFNLPLISSFNFMMTMNNPDFAVVSYLHRALFDTRHASDDFCHV